VFSPLFGNEWSFHEHCAKLVSVGGGDLTSDYSDYRGCKTTDATNFVVPSG